jgi:hypothetical protein
MRSKDFFHKENQAIISTDSRDKGGEKRKNDKEKMEGSAPEVSVQLRAAPGCLISSPYFPFGICCPFHLQMKCGQ